jgi:hypothetical protein
MRLSDMNERERQLRGAERGTAPTGLGSVAKKHAHWATISGDPDLLRRVRAAGCLGKSQVFFCWRLVG